MKRIIFLLFITVLIFSSTQLFAQDDEILELYNQWCADCHGTGMKGGNSGSLADGEWMYGSDNESIVNNIKFGIEEDGMPAFGETLSDDDIEELLLFIREEEKKYTVKEYEALTTINTYDYEINVEIYADDLDEPWSIAFSSPGNAFVTEKEGRLRVIENGKLLDKEVEGIPEVNSRGQGGLLDVALDPEYDRNGWVYLSFSHEVNGDAMTKLVRGKISDYKWTAEQVLFEAPYNLYIGTRHHYGSRTVFDRDGYLYFSIGDRGRREMAQNLFKPNGKIHRINRDGSIPDDNPFIGIENSIKSIYCYGNRNPQGLAIHPVTGELWETEHGQKGGDEVNIIRPGHNYGWDVITYGRNYDGTVSSEYKKMEGMEIPILYWTPSIAVCGIDFYSGDLFKEWNNDLLVGALKYEEVRLLDIEDNRVIHQEIILKNQGRVRDVNCGPDGAVYVVLNEPGRILRLTPVK
jgi:glucose/arabinose dehydrogenase